ncbi:tRNA 5'-guanylyltransferase [Methanoplanus sp. FWC-SCC4]|uniref:tRNA(His) guanylyltransferase n=1 Tax=Methanochimaera problematica TaxID=2609417 RepID=A0AA97I1U9_9EURY|nr:tRNA(His) guanylyltransferase Thg1 family protein [Methanoplanus sp. FWC-SCC4]WOF15555.1 tRNA 5'-guanylyltransferase [Methanoplanus sp. FWC-SCC4]
MQEREIFSRLNIVTPYVVRLDGRAFHHLTSDLGFEKPYDDRFNDAMCRVCEALISKSGLEPDFAYTFSDEISLFFSKTIFNGRVEKIDSVCASYAASALTLFLGLLEPVSFDSRVVCVDSQSFPEYFSWRQKEAWRNHMNAYCQNALIKEGFSAQQTAKNLSGVGSKQMHEMMFERGVNLAKTPAWQRRGIVVHKKSVIRKGYNPIKNEEVETERKVVVVDKDIPLFDTPEGLDYICKISGQ